MTIKRDRTWMQILMENGQFTSAKAVTPADDADLPDGITRGVYVGGAGALAIILEDDTDASVWAAVPVGTLLPIRAKRIKATGTDATLILALY